MKHAISGIDRSCYCAQSICYVIAYLTTSNEFRSRFSNHSYREKSCGKADHIFLQIASAGWFLVFEETKMERVNLMSRNENAKLAALENVFFLEKQNA